jgi:hypothetical protein
MSKLLLEEPFVPYTKGFKISMVVIGLVIASVTLIAIAIPELFSLAALYYVVAGGVISLTVVYRKSQILRVYEDRVEVRSKFLVENVRRIEASKIEAVNVLDALLGQKKYGALVITGSGGTKVAVNPIANQGSVAETIRGISSASSAKNTYVPVSSGTDDLATQLKNLSDLHAAGVLDDDEYKAAKAKLIQ